jgi:exodeoxyribonuclease V alpha subunit
MIEQVSRVDWLNRNPIVRKYIETNPTGWQTLPEFSIWPNAHDIEGISEHQAEQLSKSLSGRIGLFGGSPGTGKTYCVAKLITHMLKTGVVADYEIGIGAPTGKAAVRLSEGLERNGLSIRARTWHSILGFGTDDSGGFAHDENNPLPYRVLFGDEESMKDLALMLSVFKARPKNCSFLIVGDVNQLPPVGNGAPLRDMIAAGLPYGELKEIKRNSGGIVEACAAIRDNTPWLHFARSADSNIVITGDDSDEAKIESIIEEIQLAAERGLDPVWDCQVLVAVNESSKLSRKAMNDLLQDTLNPGTKYEGTNFRPADKIVCLKNGWYRTTNDIAHSPDIKNDSNEVYVANGELAEVIRIENGSIVAELENPARVVAISIKKPTGDEGTTATGSNWDLGYALSVHKSQGSEWPVAIVVLDSYAGARMICDRSWLYTAISRGQSRTVLVGDGELAERFCRVTKITQRKTFLKELIGIELFKREAMEDL